MEAPVLNASGTILVYCPPSVSGNEWTVFESVKVLGKHAIIDQTNLKVLHLPEGLEKIEYRAIVDCGIRELTIPFSVKEVCKNAIFGCDMLETVTILNPDTIFADGAIRWCKKLENINWAGKIRYDQICHLKGEPFLIQHTEDPANLNHCSDLKFQNLIKRCSVGDSDAMQELSVFFEQWSNKENASPFYVRASNHWRYKAYCKGNKQAADWFNRFFSEHPWERLESIVFDNYCEGEINGTYLNDLGYAFFDPDEGYSIRLCEDYPELVIASAYDSWDSPDDGFGSETDYNWWFLDENMQQIPGTKCVNASFREMSSCGQFSEEEARAIEILKQAKSKL
ncbi:MAG: leucine-rich repeat protein [Prevotellaceae bacterium]|nr:leucine-rich repeat protein [Prevotellaceae bacterium]